MKNKIILITGCSRGIGYSTALHLAKTGYKVYATVKNLNCSKNLIRKAKKYPNLIIKQMNVTNDKEIARITKELINKEKKIDILINNAAYILFGPIESISIKEAQEQFNVNLFGSIRVVQSFLPYMRKEKKGHLIFMGSTSGVHCSAMYGYYSSTKFALEAIAYALAINLFPWNIHVSLIENSATKTLICNKSLSLGKHFKKNKNPYNTYIKNSSQFLKEIIRTGEDPDNIAKFIEKIIKNEKPKFRYFPTIKSLNIFQNQLKDPYERKIKKEAQEEYLNFYKSLK